MPDRLLASRVRGRAPWARGWRPPCSPCTRCGLRPWPGPPASRICPAFVLHAVGSRLSPCISDGFIAAVGLAGGLVPPVRGGPVVPCGGGEPARGALDPGRLPAPAISGRDRAMVRAGDAESLVGEGPVCDREPCLHGPGDRGQAAITVASIEHDDAAAALPRRVTRSGFTSIKTVLPLDLIAVYPLPKELNWLALPFV